MAMIKGIVRLVRSKIHLIQTPLSVSNAQLNIVNRRFLSLSCTYFGDRRFTDQHEWIEVDGDIGTVGISNYAQDVLGDVVFAQLPDVGRSLLQKEECGALESVKAATEIYSPVSGTITNKNDSVEETPSLINSSCYEKGWLFKVHLSKPDELTSLMDEKQYQDFVKKDHD